MKFFETTWPSAKEEPPNSVNHYSHGSFFVVVGSSAYTSFVLWLGLHGRLHHRARIRYDVRRRASYRIALLNSENVSLIC